MKENFLLGEFSLIFIHRSKEPNFPFPQRQQKSKTKDQLVGQSPCRILESRSTNII